MSNLLLLIFFLLSIGWGRSWSLGGWELHDFRRTGVSSISVAVLILFFITPPTKLCFHLYQSCIFLFLFLSPSPSLHGRMLVRVSPHPHDTFPLIISISFQLFLFHSNSDGRTLTCVYSFEKLHFSSSSDANNTASIYFLPFSLSYTLPYRPFFFFFFPFPSPTSLNLVSFSLSSAFHLLTGICVFSSLVCFWTGFCLFFSFCQPILSFLFSSPGSLF